METSLGIIHLIKLVVGIVIVIKIVLKGDHAVQPSIEAMRMQKNQQNQAGNYHSPYLSSS